MDINVRRFKASDAKAVAKVVAQTLRESNSNDYSQEYIENDIRKMPAEFFIDKAQQTHFYVFCDGQRIIATGAIGSYWGSATEFSLFDIFVLPKYQGHGIGRLIIETLEQDDYFKRSDRIEIPASITGLNFYRHMGYEFKNGKSILDEERLYRLEKFRR